MMFEMPMQEVFYGVDTWKPYQLGEMLEGVITNISEIEIEHAEVGKKEAKFVTGLQIDPIDEDEPLQVLVSQWAVVKWYETVKPVVGGYARFRYLGESEQIARAGNSLKKFSIGYLSPDELQQYIKKEGMTPKEKFQSTHSVTETNKKKRDKPLDKVKQDFKASIKKGSKNQPDPALFDARESKSTDSELDKHGI